MRIMSAVAALILFGLLCPVAVYSQDELVEEPWPKEISISDNRGTVVIYQPQPEKLDGNKLEARAAVAVEETGSDAPVFGALWFTARLETDRAERTATLVDVTVTRTRFPGRDEKKQLN